MNNYMNFVQTCRFFFSPFLNCIVHEHNTEFTAHASWLQTTHVQRLSQHMTSALSVCLNIQASLALIRSLGRHTHTQPFQRPLAPFSRSLFQVDTHLNRLCNTRFFSLNTQGGGGHSWATVQIVSVRSVLHFSSSPFLFFTFLFFCPSLVGFYCE